MSEAPRLVLASASPRRAQLVGLLGLPVRLEPQDIPEEAHLLPDPPLGALSVALAKARACAAALRPGEVALAADTVVALDGRLLGKPADASDARAMLGALRARLHEVLTGVALHDGEGREWGAAVGTRVRMRAYTDAEVDAYVERGEPFDKAGAYAVQDRRFHPVERLEGCYLNVVGLPLCAVARGLETLAGYAAPGGLLPPCRFCRDGERLVEIG